MQPSLRYSFARARQLEGTAHKGPRFGIWMISANRSDYGWGQVPEHVYPRVIDPAEYLSPIPPVIDRQAKAARSGPYQLVRNSHEARLIARLNGHQLESARESGRLLKLLVAFEYTRQFIDAPGGLIEEPEPGAPILGTHSVCITGLDEDGARFVFWNNWGPGWGDQSHGYMPFEFFDHHVVESSFTDTLGPTLPRDGGLTAFRWEAPDPLGTTLFGLEVYDAAEDERIGWSFAVLRDGFLDVEELFVKPAHRRRGHGNRLVDMLRELADEQARPIRAWVPFADAGPENRPALAAILRKLGLGVGRSGVRWAAFKATPQDQPTLRFPTVRIPDRPAALPDENAEIAGVKTLRGSVLKYDDPFGPATPGEDWEASG